MTRALVLCLAASPVSAWEFSPLPICTLSHSSSIDITVTYDPAVPEYAIELTLDEPWPQGPLFAIQFTGAQSLTITTDRHTFSDDGSTLTVRDSGFGNVLNGLQFNEIGVAVVGGDGFFFPLAGAAEPVERFRNCGRQQTG